MLRPGSRMQVQAGARILIVGAGPCGLACARELERQGHRNWIILEAERQVGGLARSVLDPAGFTWDLGGHVVFSHFGEFDTLLEEVMGEDVHRHDRSSYIRFEERWVPYPFQNNLRHLPPAVRDECLAGLRAARGAAPGSDFPTWAQGVFGPGIARHFMLPYNRKVWATPLEEMSSTWIAERVAVVDAERAERNIADGRDDLGWGPNNQFAFPAVGGTGEIYRRMAARLPDRIRLGAAVARIDPRERIAELSDGTRLGYDALVSTMPITALLERLDGVPDRLREAGATLRHNSVYMVGVGYEAPLRDRRSWMYFPQAGIPFYRATNFAKYAAANVPDGDTARFCSVMTETAFSEHRPQSRPGLEDRVLAGLRRADLAPAGARVASVHVEEIGHAYPVPTLGRNFALKLIQSWLMEQMICSRGRFGSWCYEIGNMDHAVKMGIDVARLLVTGAEEELWASSGSTGSTGSAGAGGESPVKPVAAQGTR